MRDIMMALAVTVTAAGSLVAQQPRRSGADQRQQVSITVYNQNFGLVREIREVDLGRGPGELEFRDVAGQIEPYTVSVRALDGRPLRVLEQNYRYDLLSPEQLLRKYVGRTITVYRWNPVKGVDEPYQAEVISVNQSPILRIGNEITYGFPGRMTFPEIPENLIAEPTLVWLLDGDQGRRRIEASYLTKGMTWRADYVMVVNDADTRADLTGWVTLDNRSGTSYRDAQLKLVAGDVQRVREDLQDRMGRMEGLRAAAEMDAPMMTEEGLFEYHLYTLQRPTTLLDNEQKQVTLLEASGIALRKRLVLAGSPYRFRSQLGDVASSEKVSVFLEFTNAETNQLGMPLPKGIVRVYKADRAGAQQFIGEDRIDHTPRDEMLRIKMGEAFDVVADRRQMEWRVIRSCESESRWEIELRNRKDEPVEVDVMEPVGGDWTVLESTHTWERVDSRTFRFRVAVPVGDTTTVSYRVRVKWC
ncbi:MAG: DUF4139 domain-containing protein [Gemmatimonadota bacterium]|nr:DUF4139 domain-containing protein [Gemmatimonadota bacterium]